MQMIPSQKKLQKKNKSVINLEPENARFKKNTRKKKLFKLFYPLAVGMRRVRWPFRRRRRRCSRWTASRASLDSPARPEWTARAGLWSERRRLRRIQWLRASSTANITPPQRPTCNDRKKRHLKIFFHFEGCYRCHFFSQRKWKSSVKSRVTEFFVSNSKK